MKDSDLTLNHNVVIKNINIKNTILEATNDNAWVAFDGVMVQIIEPGNPIPKDFRLQGIVSEAKYWIEQGDLNYFLYAEW